MGLKLVIETFDCNQTPSWTIPANAVALTIDTVPYNVTMTAQTAATPVAAAAQIAADINAAAISANGHSLKATSTGALLAICSVQNDDVSGPASLAVSGPISDPTKWVASDVQTPYVDNYAGMYSGAQVVAAVAAGALVARLTKA